METQFETTKPEYVSWLQVVYSLRHANDARCAGLVLSTIATGEVHPDGVEWLRNICHRELGSKTAIWAAEAFHKIATITAAKLGEIAASNVVQITRKLNS
jgi:hypothetical protein